MGKYRVVNQGYGKAKNGDVVEVDAKDAAPLIENGTLEAVKEAPQAQAPALHKDKK